MTQAKQDTHQVKHGRLALVVKHDGAPVAEGGMMGVRYGLEQPGLVDHKVKDADLQHESRGFAFYEQDVETCA